MAARSILVKSWCELWASGRSVEECIAQLAERRSGADRGPASMGALAAQPSLLFDVRVVVVGATLSADEKRAHRTAALSALSFAAAPSVGHNDLRSGTKLVLFIDVGSVAANPSRAVRRAFLARVVVEEGNDLEQRYKLNARACIGPTSMPPSLAFIMSNLALVRRGRVVLDAFVGTGSLLVSAGHFGATCLGTDLDYKLLHGKTRKGPMTVLDNFKQYGFAPPEILCADLNHRVWRGGSGGGVGSGRAGWVDAIVSDPPYGVRAGARKLGRAPENKKLKTEDGQRCEHHALPVQ
jgi:tRNA (guanine10-N2)-methyltransferase